jgi:hypothetical protein
MGSKRRSLRREQKNTAWLARRRMNGTGMDF